MKLVDNLYCYIWPGAGNNANSYLIGGEMPTLIDPGHIMNESREPCLSQLLAAMADDGFKPEDMKLIINTHLHPDHCQASPELAARSKAKVAFHKADAELAAARFGRRLEEVGLKADFYLTEGELELGINQKTKLVVYHTPGHSPGSVCLYLPQSKALISGDLVFTMSVGRTDIPGGDIDQLRESIERMSKLDVEHLLPGHMAMLSGRERVQRNFAYIKRAFF